MRPAHDPVLGDWVAGASCRVAVSGPPGSPGPFRRLPACHQIHRGQRQCSWFPWRRPVLMGTNSTELPPLRSGHLPGGRAFVAERHEGGGIVLPLPQSPSCLICKMSSSSEMYQRPTLTRDHYEWQFLRDKSTCSKGDSGVWRSSAGLHGLGRVSSGVTERGSVTLECRTISQRGDSPRWPRSEGPW